KAASTVEVVDLRCVQHCEPLASTEVGEPLRPAPRDRLHRPKSLTAHAHPKVRLILADPAQLTNLDAAHGKSRLRIALPKRSKAIEGFEMLELEMRRVHNSVESDLGNEVVGSENAGGVGIDRRDEVVEPIHRQG